MAEIALAEQVAGMTKWLTWAGGMLALIGTILTGWLFIDDRFAKAAEVQQQVDDVKQLYLKSERRELQRQQFDLAVAKERRKLTTIEEQRVQQVEQEKKDIDQQIQQVEKKRSITK